VHWLRNSLIALGRRAGRAGYHGAVLRVEFTIEPFVEGQPGPHVLSGVAAAEAMGVTVEFGPFGSTCTVAPGQAGAVLGAIVDAAVANGASNVTVDIARLDDEPLR
jgi:hypothetical protein